MPQTMENSLPHFWKIKCLFLWKSTCRLQLLLKLRKVICSGIAGSGGFEVFDRCPVLQTGAVLEFFSGGVYERSACTGTGDDIFLWYLDP